MLSESELEEMETYPCKDDVPLLIAEVRRLQVGGRQCNTCRYEGYKDVILVDKNNIPQERVTPCRHCCWHCGSNWKPKREVVGG